MSEIFTALNQVEKLGWRSVVIEGGWQLGHPSVKGVVYLSLTSQWLSLVYPLLSAGQKDSGSIAHLDQIRIYRYLLKRNERMYMAKFGLDAEESPILMVEVPARGSLQLTLKWALDTLRRYISEDSLGGDIPAVLPGVKEISADEATYPPDDTPGLPKETIGRYLKGVEAKGWRVRTTPPGLGLHWNLGYRGRLRLFKVDLTVSQNWTYFQAPVLLEGIPSVLKEDRQLQTLFLKYLLRLNYTWFMAKLGLDADGCLILLLEVPTEVLDFTLFQLATSTLATYLDRYVQEIQIMASLQHDQGLVKLLNSVF